MDTCILRIRPVSFISWEKWLFAWPTIPTAIMGIILLGVYYKLARTEEKELENEFGKKYLEYKKNTPFLL